MKQPTKIQRAIAAELRRRGLTRYAFAKSCGIPVASIYVALSRPASTKYIPLMAEKLGLTLQKGRTNAE